VALVHRFGERLRKAVKVRTWRIRSACVFSTNWRTVMSSIMRRRNGLMRGLMGISLITVLLS
jgi:hypothetical protein